MSYHDAYRERERAALEFRESLTPGTEVFITTFSSWGETHYQKATVSRLTKTQIIFDNFFHKEPAKFYKKDGELVGSKGESYYSRTRYGIQPINEQNKAIVRRQQLVNKTYLLLKDVQGINLSKVKSLEESELKDARLALEDLIKIFKGEEQCNTTEESTTDSAEQT